jgi:hypothetical protein
MGRKAAVVLLIGVSLLGRLVRAHEGHEHVMGTVSAVDQSHVEVKSKDGKTTSVLLTGDTKYLKGTAPATAADLKVGIHVVIHVTPKGDTFEATEVRLATPRPVKAAPSPQP